MISKQTLKVVSCTLVLVACGLSLLGFQGANTFPIRRSGAVVANNCTKWVDARTIADAGSTCGAAAGTVTASGTLTNGNVIKGAGTSVVTDSGIAATNLVTASSPGAGLCHFAGSTQACTSSAVVNADVTSIDASTKLTGVTPPANGGVANITAAGLGGFYSNGILLQSTQTAPTSGPPGTSNQVRAFQFVLPMRITVSKIVLNVVVNAASSHISVGIYDSAGTTKLIDSGTYDSSTTGVKSNTITPVTLTPGVYYFAQTTSDVTVTCSSFVSPGGTWQGITNQNVVRFGTAANVSVAGALPSALGALSTSNIPAIVAFFEP